MKSKTCTIFLLMISLSVISAFAAERTDLDARVAALLSKMSLEEKVGQMTQLTLETVCDVDNSSGTLKTNSSKLYDVIVQHHVGSILNVGTSAHSVDQWQQIITAIQDMATKKSRLGIPVLYGIDAIHGANYTQDATIFPQNIAMAATWNPELMKRDGEVTACEVRASGIPWNFNPVLGVGRQPLWPRFWETFGEDPYLTSEMGAAYIKGLEGENNNIVENDKVAACMKHYLGYSFPLSGKDRTPAWIPDRMLREIFLPPFKAAVDAGVHTVMVNSSEINGISVHSSHYFLTDLLRGELGFQGVIVSDWADIINLYEREKVAVDNKDAVHMAVLAGIDMSMVPYDYSYTNALIELVKEGSVPESRIDASVARILKLKFELGLFEHPYPNKDLKKKFAGKEHQAVNLEAARESITLLKNAKNILPLKKSAKILVTGPTADKLSCLNGGWTITWQGDKENLYPKDKLTILKAIENKVGKNNVVHVPGATVEKVIDIPAAVRAADKSDAVVVCIGEAAYCESEGNITDLTLPEPQLRLVHAIAQTGTPVVLILAEGRPRVIRGIVDDASAIVMAYFPGMEGGQAIADVLFGDVNPSGKLPFTYPRFVNDFTHYDYKNSENVSKKTQYNPQWPFGFGLSYTHFKYSDLMLDANVVHQGGSMGVSVTVKNSGSLPGNEIVQLYLSDLVASVTPANKRLRGFSKIHLEPGEGKTISFRLQDKDFSFIGRNNKSVTESGKFKVTVGGLSQEFELLK